ncbi:MAG: TonB-dependent receptor plug domain-containing protein [Ignavibacteriales bacterium]|nr:TonB-dependent receptor plug domain-containing protein [Ignavibacteriales bacterium]
MNKILFIILLFLSNVGYLVAQRDTLQLSKEKKITNDSLSIKKIIVIPDTTTKKDSLTISNDSLKARKPAAINPIHQKGFLLSNDFGTILNRNQLLTNDYRYTGDFINQFPLGFIRDFGSLGQPNEILIYGSGYNSVSYLQDGMLLNNRFTNTLDLNNVQSESIDSIEIIPSVRGFLYGNLMNPVSINFISRNDFSIEGKKAPYSRLRYYQASYEEAMVDAILRTNISRRLIGFFEATNNTIGNRFQNSSYGAWKATAKLNYLISENFNLIGNYFYSKSEVQLFGGIDLDSLQRTTSEITSEYQDPVISLTRYQKSTDHNIYLKLLNNLSSNFSGELSAYYRFNLLEYRQNEKGIVKNEALISRNHITKVLGSTFRETYNNEFLSADLIANYEKIFVNTDLRFNKIQDNSVSLAGKVSFRNADSKIIPSVFGRFLYYNNQSLYGFGGDATINYSNSASLYGGASYFQKPMNLNEPVCDCGERYSKITNIEAGLKFKHENMLVSTNLFYKRIVKDIPSINMETFGIGLNLGLNIWQIFIENNAAAYYNKIENNIANSNARNYLLPEFTFRGGIFYKDILFDSNLNLKVGISANVVGTQDLYSYDFERSNVLNRYPYLNGSTSQNIISKLKPSLVFDFVLVGTIQNRATIYFTVENLLDKVYYIVPFYTKQGRGMRLGVAWEFLN